MRLAIIILLSTLGSMDIFAQEAPTDRQPVAAGRFYSDNKEILRKDLEQLFISCKNNTGSAKVRALICPHAGYVFSGRIAASAFSTIDRNTAYKNIFIIGSSHVMAFDGASAYSSGDYITPLGKVSVNREIASRLTKENKVFNFPTTSHISEHSIEVQLPFIQYYFKSQPKIVPVIIGTGSEKTIRKIAEALLPWFTPENLFVISSDFSHYPSYADAIESDRYLAESIESGDPASFLNAIKKDENKHFPGLVTSMCGWTSGLTLLYLTEGSHNLEIKLIDYCNSGDSKYGDKNEVVGYNAIAVFDKAAEDEANTVSADRISFTDAEKKKLFEIAWNSIRMKLDGKRPGLADEKSLPPALKVPMGAFVTLKIGGNLRGCIGRFISSSPIYEVVQASALSSAFEDPRFEPVTKEELKKISMEITAIGPLKKINSISEIVLGRHGIYIKKGSSAGTMLPQVATENHWNVEQFLGYTSRDKAGIGWDGWKDADIFIYEGIVLEETGK
jgi:MEMO1 family protein